MFLNVLVRLGDLHIIFRIGDWQSKKEKRSLTFDVEKI